MKAAVPLEKNILAPLGKTAATSEIDAGIQNKIHGSGITTIIISNKEMNDIVKLFMLLKILIFYWKASLKQLENERKSEDF